jgi:ABC-type bacteriocin/lantibiotic exporter with double-glycine peptidase domain
MRAVFPILVVLLLLFPARPGDAQEAPAKSGFSCGLNAAYIFLKRTGHHPDYLELEEEFARQTPSNSMLAIRNVLRNHGCATVGVKAGADYFLQKGGPAIVLLQFSGFGPSVENHFCYLLNVTRQEGASFLDPFFDTRQPACMTWDTFVRLYQGVALVSHE